MLVIFRYAGLARKKNNKTIDNLTEITVFQDWHINRIINTFFYFYNKSLEMYIKLSLSSNSTELEIKVGSE